MNDLKFAFRQLSKNPGFTAVAVLTLALGIGATSSVFSLVHGVLLTPPPYRKPERIVLINPARIDGQPYAQGCAAAQWTEWKRAAKSFQAWAGYNWGFDYLVLPNGSESVEGMFVTEDYFEIIGVKPLLGRGFLASDAPSPKEEATAVVLGEDLWRRRFKGDTDILGKAVRLSRHPPLTVVGVMPRDMRFLPSPRNAHLPNYDVNAHVDFWMPASLDEAKPKEPIWNVVGRLHDGATLAEARAELAAITARQAKVDQDFEGITAKAELLTAELNREGRRVLLPLLGAVGLVFLIACGNVAGLLLARGLQRQHEYVMRCALGAGRLRLFRQVLTESLLFALLGGVLGAGLAMGSLIALKAMGGTAIPRLDAVATGWPMLTFCFGSAVLAAALAGLAPAFRASRLDPASGIQAAGPTTSTSPHDRRFLGGVAILQTAMTLALLVGAGLLVRTVNNLARVRLGYDTQNILTMSITQVRHAQNVEGMDDDKAWARRFVDFHRRALTQVGALPGVKHAAFAWGVPLTGNKWIGEVTIEEQPAARRLKDPVAVPMRAVTPEYFDTVALPIVEGRNFRSMEAFSWPPAFTDVPNVAIINQAMAEQHFAKVNPIGRKLRFDFENVRATAEIIGVAANSRSETLTQKAQPEIYFSYWQLPAGTKHLVIRTTSDPRSLVTSVERELRAMDPTIVFEDVRTFEQIRSESIAPRLFAMRLLVGFSFVASVLALVGIYGVLSVSVGCQSRAIAIRIAVGAQRRHILNLVFGEGLRLIAVGLILGVFVAIALARVLGKFLFGVGPSDPTTLIGVALMFTTVALLACWVPARRAARVDPMEALRYE